MIVKCDKYLLILLISIIQCVNHWECCSNSCLSFAYRCVPKNQPNNGQVSLIWEPAQTPQNSNAKPNVLVNRFDTSENLPTTNASPSPKCSNVGEYVSILKYILYLLNKNIYIYINLCTCDEYRFRLLTSENSILVSKLMGLLLK